MLSLREYYQTLEEAPESLGISGTGSNPSMRRGDASERPWPPADPWNYLPPGIVRLNVLSGNSGDLIDTSAVTVLYLPPGAEIVLLILSSPGSAVLRGSLARSGPGSMMRTWIP